MAALGNYDRGDGREIIQFHKLLLRTCSMTSSLVQALENWKVLKRSSGRLC